MPKQGGHLTGSMAQEDLDNAGHAAAGRGASLTSTPQGPPPLPIRKASLQSNHGQSSQAKEQDSKTIGQETVVEEPTDGAMETDQQSVEALSPSVEMAPAMSSLAVSSGVHAMPSLELNDDEPQAGSKAAPLSPSQSGTLVGEPRSLPKSPPPPIFANGKLNINHTRSPSGTGPKPMYMPPSSPPPSHGLKDGLRPSFSASAQSTQSSPPPPRYVPPLPASLPGEHKLETDHIEVLDPQVALGAMTDSTMEDLHDAAALDEEETLAHQGMGMFRPYNWDRARQVFMRSKTRARQGASDDASGGDYSKRLAASANWLDGGRLDVHSSPEASWDSAIGPGIIASRLLEEGPHHHHLASVWGVLPLEDSGQDSKDNVIRNMIKTNLADGGAYGWWFCTECSMWFRLGVGYLEDGGMSMVAKHNDNAGIEVSAAPSKEEFLVGPDVELAKLLHNKANLLQDEHDQTHHFHPLKSLLHLQVPPQVILSSPSSLKDEDMQLSTEWESFEQDRTVSLHKCCQCHLSVYYDETPMMPGCLPQTLLQRIFEREPKPGQASDQRANFAKLIGTLFRLVDDGLRKGIEGGVKANGKVLRDVIGMDDAGRELMARSGFRLVETLGEDDSSEATWKLSSENEQDSRWVTRVWIELRLVLANLQSLGELASANVQTTCQQVDNLFECLRLSISLVPAMKRAVGNAKALPPFQILGAPKAIPEPLDTGRQSTPSAVITTNALGCCWNDPCETICSAYLAQIHCDPARTPKYYGALRGLAYAADLIQRDSPDVLRNFVHKEATRGITNENEFGTLCSAVGTTSDIIDVIDNLYGTNYQSGRSFLIQQITDSITRVRNDPLTTETDKEALYRNVRSLSRTINSPELIKLGDEMHRQLFGLKNAAKKYNVDDPKNLEADLWVTLFEYAVAEAADEHRKEEVREDFRLIAQELDVIPLKRLLSMEIPPEPPRDPVPAGLHNIGNTCYLNSLLQYLCTLQTFRESIIELSKCSPQSDTPFKAPRVGGRLLSEMEVQRARNFVKELAGLFTSLAETLNGAVTPNRSLAYLALVTASDEVQNAPAPKYETSPVATPMEIESSIKPDETRPERDPLERSTTESILGKRTQDDLEREKSEETDQFDAMETSETRRFKAIPNSRSGSRSLSNEPESESDKKTTESEPRVVPDEDERDRTGHEDKTDQESAIPQPMELKDTKPTPPSLPPRRHRSSINTDMMFGQQHDISECLDNVLFQVEAVALTTVDANGRPFDNIIKSLFYGQSQQRLMIDGQTIEDGAGDQSTQEVSFNSLYLSVRDEASSDLYEKLSEVYFGFDEVQVGGKQAQKVLELQSLPPVLQIQLERAQYDRELGRAYKSNTYLKFEETLYMDRFLPSADPTKRERTKKLMKELMKAREKLSVLQDSKPQPIVNTMKLLNEALGELKSIEGLELDVDGLQGTLRVTCDRVDKQIAETQEFITKTMDTIQKDWADEKECEYELSSVFMHRGQAGFGHYWLYQRNLPGQPDEYFKFNDEQVTKVPKQEVLGDTTGSNANPYLLVYVKKGSGMVEAMAPSMREEQIALEETKGDTEVVNESIPVTEATTDTLAQQDSVQSNDDLIDLSAASPTIPDVSDATMDVSQ